MRKRQKLILASIVCLMLYLAAASSLMMGVASSKQERIRVIIGFKQKPNADLVKGHDGKIRHRYKIIPAIACFLPEKAINVLRRHPKIAYVELDSEVKALDDTLDWGVDRIDAEIVWGGAEDATDVAQGRNAGDGIKIAIIDTGMDHNHPDLNDNYAGGYDFFNDDPDPMDDHGHGTHVAGIIAAEDDAGGIIGVAPKADLYALKALNSAGSGYVSDIVAAIDWAVANGMQIISMSIGSNSDDTSFRSACNKAYDEGLLLVAAAGNDGYWPWGDSVDYPARYSSVIAVAATDKNDNRPNWSSRGPSVELAAPGVNIYSTYWDNSYATMSGTSMACPHVSGTAALVFDSPVDPAYDSDSDGAWDASEVREKLKDTADDLGSAGRDNLYGWGLVDADEAAPESGDKEPPAKVTDLAVTTVSQSELSLAWNANTEEDLDHYNVYRSKTSGFTPATENRIASPTTNSYLDTGLEASTTYYYKVTAVDTSRNEGAASDEAPGTTTGDTAGPATSDVVVSPNPTHGATSVTLTATIDDSTTGKSIIDEAEYFIGIVGDDGTGTPMTASDGAFDSPTEGVTADITVSGWALDDYTLYVHGKDAEGKWGPVGSVVLHVTEAVAYAMHVDSIDMSKETMWWGLLKRAKAVVTILDAEGKPVDGAAVYGSWSGLISQSVSGVTGSDGKVTFYTVWFLYITSGKCIFTVDDVTKTDWTYDPGANKETSDSINI